MSSSELQVRGIPHFWTNQHNYIYIHIYVYTYIQYIHTTYIDYVCMCICIHIGVHRYDINQKMIMNNKIYTAPLPLPLQKNITAPKQLVVALGMGIDSRPWDHFWMSGLEPSTEKWGTRFWNRSQLSHFAPLWSHQLELNLSKLTFLQYACRSRLKDFPIIMPNHVNRVRVQDIPIKIGP